jgi:hypothetical protein
MDSVREREGGGDNRRSCEGEGWDLLIRRCGGEKAPYREAEEGRISSASRWRLEENGSANFGL